MSEKESELMRKIQVAVSEAGGRVFRNNSGYAELAHGRWLKYGVGNPGGSDLIGWTSEGKFLAIEVKSKKGILTEQQSNFINEVNRSGGIAFMARSVEEVLSHVGARF